MHALLASEAVRGLDFDGARQHLALVIEDLEVLIWADAERENPAHCRIDANVTEYWPAGFADGE